MKWDYNSIFYYIIYFQEKQEMTQYVYEKSAFFLILFQRV